MSSCGRGPKLSLRRRAASGISASPIGTLSQKIQCQLIPPAIAPPTTDPTATASPVMPPHRPIATPRFSVGKASLIRVNVNGVTTAAPGPRSARAAISAATLDGTAKRTEAPANTPTTRTSAPARVDSPPTSDASPNRESYWEMTARYLLNQPELSANCELRTIAAAAREPACFQGFRACEHARPHD
jgi:hypothetical protein